MGELGSSALDFNTEILGRRMTATKDVPAMVELQ